jgi:hypothetical protein
MGGPRCAARNRAHRPELVGQLRGAQATHLQLGVWSISWAIGATLPASHLEAAAACAHDVEDRAARGSREQLSMRIIRRIQRGCANSRLTFSHNFTMTSPACALRRTIMVIPMFVVISMSACQSPRVHRTPKWFRSEVAKSQFCAVGEVRSDHSGRTRVVVVELYRGNSNHLSEFAPYDLRTGARYLFLFRREAGPEMRTLTSTFLVEDGAISVSSERLARGYNVRRSQVEIDQIPLLLSKR